MSGLVIRVQTADRMQVRGLEQVCAVEHPAEPAAAPRSAAPARRVPTPRAPRAPALASQQVPPAP